MNSPIVLGDRPTWASPKQIPGGHVVEARYKYSGARRVERRVLEGKVVRQWRLAFLARFDSVD
jgi:hypothetical protein